MVDIQDRRYLAQCTQQLPSSALAHLLDLLLTKHPSEVVERKGGESYHIDFGTLSAPAYAEAREFIKKTLGDDDDFGFSENERKVINALSKFNGVNGQEESEERLRHKAQPPLNQVNVLSGPSLPLQVPAATVTQNRSHLSDVTPSMPYPSISTRSKGASELIQESKHLPTLSPEKTTTKQLKRVRLTPSPPAAAEKAKSGPVSHPVKKDESRYYNGERVWRNATEDLHFNFHGIDVILLSLQTETKRPWKCGTCSKAFVSKDKIVNHVQQHSGEKIHECPTCKGKFSSKHYLKEHQKRVHLFHCHHCEEVFDTFDELHAHATIDHPAESTLKECSCKKGCNNSRCSCFKNGLNCTTQCQCLNCNNLA
jgi:hypothetical protein